MTTLVDANVLLDLFTDDPQWADWSSAALAQAAGTGGVAIDPIVYAEVSLAFARIEDLDEALVGITRLTLPYEAGFLAARCFERYRRAGGARRSRSRTSSSARTPPWPAWCC